MRLALRGWLGTGQWPHAIGSRARVPRVYWGCGAHAWSGKGGQCCGALTDITAYRIQLETIEHFIVENGGRDIIPADPYDLTVEVSQQLTQIDKDITLSSEQQMTFDNAVAMSHHGGPCCCKCWKWFVMSGLAKNLIVEEKWNQNQIAELWDISSSCGHAEDTDMHAHYS